MRGTGRSLGWSADRGFADKDGTGLDREGFGLDVPDNLGAGLEFDAVGGGKIAVNLAVNDDDCGFDFRFDPGIFTDGEVARGMNFAFNFPVNDEVVGELDNALDFHVGGEHVAGSNSGPESDGGGLRSAIRGRAV